MLKEFNLNYITANSYDYFLINKKPIYSLLNEKFNGVVNLVTNMPFDLIKQFDGDRTIIKAYDNNIMIFERSNYYNIYFLDFKNIEDLKDPLFNWQNFTIDMIYETSNNEFIDYEYKYRNKNIQAIKDVEYKQIRLLNANKNSLIEKPEQILQAFAYMSEYGFEIETQSLSCISKNINLLSNIDLISFKNYMKDILYGKNIINTINLMKSLNVFNIDIEVNGKKVNLLNSFNYIDFSNLEMVNNGFHMNWIETLSLLLKDNKDELDNLIKLELINEEESKKINWIIDNFDLINNNDYREPLYKAKTGIVEEKGLMQMKELLLNLSKIYLKIYPDRKEQIDKITFDFCRRPYFKNQIKVEDAIFIEIANDDNEKLLDLSKEKLLYKLIKTDKLPKELNDYMQYVNEAVEEAVNEKMMSELGII